jgi:hypothetical protein
MTNQGLKELMATSTWQDNERKIAAAELRRQAKAARGADRSSDRVVAASVPAFGTVAGAWRSLCRGLAGVVVRRATA